MQFISEAEGQTGGKHWEKLQLSLPVCLFLRWLIRGAELGVGLLPLGRNRAAPFTVRKLSLILEGGKKERKKRYDEAVNHDK